MNMKDNGQRMSFETGAIREPHEGKGAYALIPQVSMHRTALRYEGGGKKYEPRNWEKGIPNSNCMESLLRHAFQASAGMTDEDHLAAVVWNAFTMMYNEAYHPEMCDIPEQPSYPRQLTLEDLRVDCSEKIYSFAPVQGNIITGGDNGESI